MPAMVPRAFPFAGMARSYSLRSATDREYMVFYQEHEVPNLVIPAKAHWRQPMAGDHLLPIVFTM